MTQHAFERRAGLPEPGSVLGVNDKDESIGRLDVMLPQLPDFGLSAYIPHDEIAAVVSDFFAVEANGGDGVDFFAEQEAVDAGGLARIVQPEEDDPLFDAPGEEVHHTFT